MNHQENLFSPIASFFYLIVFVYNKISIEMESTLSWIMSTRSSQCHSNPVLFTPYKTTYPVIYLYDSHDHVQNTGVDIWKIMDVIPS